MERLRQSGALVRSSASLSSAKVAELPGGTRVKYDDRFVLEGGRTRLHLVVPLEGWISEKCLAKGDALSQKCEKYESSISNKMRDCERSQSQFEDAYWLRAQEARLDSSRAKDVMRALEELVLSQRPDEKRFYRDAGVASTRIFALSDVHLDHPGAVEWVESVKREDYCNDVLILAGDLGDTLKAVEVCLKLLRPKFRRLFYCPGNHCLWIREVEEGTYPDSIAKWNALRALCESLDCDTTPAQVAVGVYVVPLLSWYDPDFFLTTQRGRARRAFDTFCKWPVKESDLKHVFLKWNQVVLSRCPRFDPDSTVVTFSHFHPRPELPFSRHVEDLEQAIGCAMIDSQLRSIVPRPTVHVYGHSHLNFSKLIDGVRYVQNAFGYSHERHNGAPCHQLACVHPE